MKHSNIILCVLILLSIGCENSTTEPEVVLTKEQQRVEFLTTGQYDKLSEILSSTMSYTHSSAVIETKEEFLHQLQSGQVIYRSMVHENVNVRFIYSNVAIMNGITDVIVTVGGEDLEVPLRFTLVYVKRDGEWLFEAWHSVQRP